LTTEAAAKPEDRSWVVSIHGSETGFTPLLGTGVLIDDYRVLTSAHVALHSDGTERDPLWVAFPTADSAHTPRRRVIRVVCSPAATDPSGVEDVALLVLELSAPPGVRPAPVVGPKSTDLLSNHWWAFGFPNQQGFGDTAVGIVGDALGYGWVRLDTETRAGRGRVEEGFSGAGLWSGDYQKVVAIVGRADGPGDAQALTLHRVNDLLEEEKLHLLFDKIMVQTSGTAAVASWGWSLVRDDEGIRHWRPRARGVPVESEGGYRFRGRTGALTEIVDWLDSEQSEQRALVVTGSAGVGKSAVLGRIVTTADEYIRRELPADDYGVKARVGSVGCAVHAQGKTALEVAAEIARAAGVALPHQLDDLLPALRDALMERGRTFSVVIDALDEARTPEHARLIVTRIVVPLVETYAEQGVRVVVGSRRTDKAGNLLSSFGDRLKLVDLDEEAYFSTQDLSDYALATLQLIGSERKGNPYGDTVAARRVADRIAEDSHGNFLTAGIVARTHGMFDDAIVSLADLVVPGDVYEALLEYMSKFGRVGDVSAEEALAALAMAEAPGLPLELWQVATNAMMPAAHVTTEDLAAFAEDSKANFLVESTGESGAAAYRLYHQALNEAVLRARARSADVADDERKVTRAFIEHGRDGGWDHAQDYLLRSLPLHAWRTQEIDELLIEDDYLLHAILPRLIPLADYAVTEAGLERARLLHLTPQAIGQTPEIRAALFSVTETLEGLGKRFVTHGLRLPYKAIWASVQPRSEWAVLGEGPEKINGVSGIATGDQVLVASAGADLTVRIWNAATSESRHTMAGHGAYVNGVCAYTAGGLVLVASAGDDGTVRIWDAIKGGQERHNIPLRSGAVYGVCAFNHDGTMLLATASEDGGVRLWDASTGEQKHQHPLGQHDGPAYGVCAVHLGNRTLIASGGADHLVRLWDAAAARPDRVLAGHTREVNAVWSFEFGGRALLASASADRTVRIWNPLNGRLIQELHGHSDSVFGVCAVSVDNRVLLATAGGDGIRLWDVATWNLYRQLEADTGPVYGVCPLTVEGRRLVASANDDGTVRLWDAVAEDQHRAVGGHTGQVNGVCTFASGGRALAATASNDHTIRVWDPETGRSERAITGHTNGVLSVCAFDLDGQTLLASGGKDYAVRIWNPKTGDQITSMARHRDWVNSVCALKVGDQVLLASGSDDARVRLWDHQSGAVHTLQGHLEGVRSVCTFTVRDQVLLASASADGTVRIWDPEARKLHGTMKRVPGAINGITSAEVDGRVLLITAGEDHTVRLWDAESGEHLEMFLGHTGEVTSVCSFTRDGVPVLASTSRDRTVRTWDLRSRKTRYIIPVHHVATSASAWTDGMVLVGLRAGLIALSPKED
jgi:WD40 repeat protein